MLAKQQMVIGKYSCRRMRVGVQLSKLHERLVGQINYETENTTNEIHTHTHKHQIIDGEKKKIVNVVVNGMKLMAF